MQSLERREAELAGLNRELEKTAGRNCCEPGASCPPGAAKPSPTGQGRHASNLHGLGFQQSQFDVSCTPAIRFRNASGMDEIEFQFAPNPGEPPRPLRAIASSGEMSRVMLALKTVLAEQDEIPVLVFDEIDANVGGETAVVVGEKMRANGASSPGDLHHASAGRGGSARLRILS